MSGPSPVSLIIEIATIRENVEAISNSDIITLLKARRLSLLGSVGGFAAVGHARNKIFAPKAARSIGTSKRMFATWTAIVMIDTNISRNAVDLCQKLLS